MFKKFLAVALSVTMAFGMVACGSNNDSEDTVKTDYGTVQLKNYKGLVAYEDDIKVDDSTLQSTIDQDLSQHATTETIKKGTVKSDSSVVFDYTGKIEINGKKVKFDGGSATDQTADVKAKTVGGNKMIDGFVDALKGHKVGDTFTAKLKFPKGYGKKEVNGKKVDFSNKDVWFTYKIKSLQKKNTPKLDDKFVKDNYEKSEGLTTVKAYKEYLKKQLRNSNIMQQVMQEYLDSCKAEKYDDDFLKELESQQLAQYAQYGIKDLDSYLQATGMKEADFKKQIKENSKTYMVYYAIAQKEVGSIDDWYKKKAADYVQKKSGQKLDAFIKTYTGYGYTEDQAKDVIKQAYVSEVVQNAICDNIKLKKGSKPTTTAETTTAAETTATETTEAATTK